MNTDEAKEYAISLIMKQVPMRPVHSEKHFLSCPRCGGTDLDYDGQYNYNYCPDCGQKLKWDKEDDD